MGLNASLYLVVSQMMFAVVGLRFGVWVASRTSVLYIIVLLGWRLGPTVKVIFCFGLASQRDFLPSTKSMIILSIISEKSLDDVNCHMNCPYGPTPVSTWLISVDILYHLFCIHYVPKDPRDHGHMISVLWIWYTIISLLKILSLSLALHFGIHHLAFSHIRLRRIHWMLTVP